MEGRHGERDAAARVAPRGLATAFDEAFARLRVRVERACLAEPDSDWPAQVSSGITAALDFAAAHPGDAQALTNDALAMGKDGFSHYDRMLSHFAAGLLPGRTERPDGELLPEITEKMMVGGLASLIAQRLDFGRHAELPALAPEAIQFVLTPYLGTDEARRVARTALD
jgi:hypothetical protein